MRFSRVRFPPIADVVPSRHSDTVFRIVALAGLLLITGCNGHREPPKSMCDLPRSFATWEHTDVRWQGILLNATPHGMMLRAEDCQRRGIQIERWPVDADDALGRLTRQNARESGVIRVDVSGRITAGRMLAVSKVHRIELEPMSEQQETEFWRSIGS